MVALVAVAVGGIWVPPLRVAVALGYLVLLALVVWDFARTPSPARLRIRRHLPARAGLSVDFERVARVEAGPAAGLTLELFEEFSPELEVRRRTLFGELVPPASADPSGGVDRVRLGRRGAVECRRVYRGHRRGIARLGRLRVRLTGALGLVQRQARLSGELAVRIEPALLGLRHTLRLAASERWRDLGVARLRRRGGVTEFESLRDYVPGDDVRLVDWKAFARRGRPTVREYQEERGQELVVLVDCGRRMGATTGEGSGRGWSKLDHALDAALQLAAVALDRGDRVGMAAYDARLRAWVAPGRGARQLARLTRAVFDLAPSERESDLEGALREVTTRHRRRALLLLFTDVADPLSVPSQRRALAVGARRNRVVFAGLDDPSLRRAAEGSTSHPPAVRAAACALVAERSEGLAELARSGARVIDVLPAEAAAPVLAAWLEARRTG